MIDGFGERTRGVAALLRATQTCFLIVSSPEPEPAQEARYLAERLSAAGMAGARLIVNRAHLDGLGEHSETQAHELIASALGERLGARVAANLADFDALARRDRDTISELAAAIGERDPIVVPHLDEEVQDLLGLARVAEHLLR